MILRCLLVVFLSLLVSSSAIGQTASMANDYWLSYLPSLNNEAPLLALVSTNTPNTKVWVTYTDDKSVDSFIVSPNSPKEYRIRRKQSKDGAYLAKPDLDETVQKRSAHITSDAPISVQQFTDGDNNVSLSLPLPTKFLGKSYVVSAYYDQHPELSEATSGLEPDILPLSGGEFIIIATLDDTRVGIKLTGKTRGGQHSGDSITVTLNRGETYWVRGSGESSSNDLSRTRITATKSIAVASGAEIARYFQKLKFKNDFDYNDHIAEYLLPTEQWDTLYVTPPLANKNSHLGGLVNTLYRIYSVEQTELFVNGQSVGPGKYWEYSHGPEPYIFRASKPIMVVEYDFFSGLGSILPRSSNSMMILPPRSHWVKKLTATIPAGYEHTYLYVTAHKDSIASITVTINGKTSPINTLLSSPTVNIDSYRILTLSLDTVGAYTIEGSCQFSVLNHGTRDNDTPKPTYGYGAIAGSTYKPTASSLPQQLIHTIDSNCTGFTVHLTDVSQSDFGIESVSLVKDTSGVKEPSKNFSLTETTPVNGSKMAVVHVTPTVLDTAYLYVKMFDDIDRYIPIVYNGQQFVHNDIGDFFDTKMGIERCSTIVIRNTAPTPLLIDSLHRTFLSQFEVTINNTIPVSIASGDSLMVEICYSPKDTNEYYSDTVVLYSGCRQYRIAINDASSYTNQLVAGDGTFDNVKPGETTSRFVFLANRGNHPLSVLSATSNNFSIYVDPMTVFPITIEAGKSSSARIIFEPAKLGLDSAIIFWKTNIDEPFDQSIKPYSILYGTANTTGGVLNAENEIVAITISDKDISVSLDQTEKLLGITLTNINGVEFPVESVTPSQSEYRTQLPSLVPGAYFLRVQTSKRALTHKFVNY